MVDRIGQQLGNYRLLRLLGQGGFADVYLAEHIHLETLAAVKVLSMRLASDGVEHFRSEARTIARLIHPHIVRVLDFGVEDNTPYLAMDYAPNGNLRQLHPKGTRLPRETIVNYVKQIAEALQYAHEKKLIHRDIKPENILLGENQQLLLSDFGIALVTQSTHYQSTQEVIGTAAYMAPEQLQGKPRRASDQYSLGIVVYEWLCGDRPFHGTFTELYSQHMFVPPPPLGEKVPTISSDVEQVVLTALAKDPKERFANVQAFARALEQTCEAAPFSPIASQSQTLLPTAEAIPHSQHMWPPITAPSANQPLQQNLITATPGKIQPFKGSISRRIVVAGLASLAVAGSGLAWLVHSQGTARPTFSSTTGSTIIAGHAVTSSASKTAISTRTSPPIGTTLLTYHGHSSWMTTARWSPNGTQIASGSADRTVQVWDAVTGNTLYNYRGHSDVVIAAEWSPNGVRIASSGNDRTVQVWDPTTGGNVFTYRGHSNIVYDVAWSPDGTRIASCSWDSTVQVWNAATGNLLLTYRGHVGFVFDVAWSPDGRKIVSAGNDVQVWDVATGTTIYTYDGHSDFVRKVLWSPDGTRIASGSHDKTVQVWDADTGGNVVIYRGHSDEIDDMAWLSSKQLIASSGADHTVQIWKPADGSTVFIYRGHSAKINAVGWSPDGTRIVSGDDSASVQVWQAS